MKFLARRSIEKNALVRNATMAFMPAIRRVHGI